MYKYEVSVKGTPVKDEVFAKDSEHAKRMFCSRRGLSIDHSRMEAKRIKEV